MQKVIRLTALGILTLAGLTACGDKVTNIQQTSSSSTTPTTTSPGHAVHLVTVTPASVSIVVGQSTQLVANVTADSGVARTVTWSSASSAIATVDANGNVTGKSAGTAVIVATSTADPTQQGTAAVTVSGVNNPSITISSLTNNLGQPATLNNIAGQLNVTLNVDPGSSIIQRIDLLMSCNGGPQVIVATQIIGSTVAGKVVAPSTWGLGLKTASTTSPKGVLANVSRSTPTTSTASSPAPSAVSAAIGSTPAPVTLSFNTAALDSTGAPIFHNGQCTLTGKLTTTTGATFTSSNSVTITLNNVSGYTIKSLTSVSTNTGFPNSGISPVNGLVYNQGNVVLTLQAVNFTTAAPLKTITGAFMGIGFTATPTAGTQTFVITFPNDSTQTFVRQITATGGPGATPQNTVGTCASNCLGIYQYFTANNAAGEPGPTVTSSIDTLGNQGFSSGGPIVANTGFRVDNRSPEVPTTAIVNANAGSNDWINGTYTFLGTGKYKSFGDSTFGAGTIIKIGYASSVGYTGLVGGTAEGNAYCATTGFTTTAVSSTTTSATVFAGQPTSGFNNVYQARAFEYDALGNVRCSDLTVSNGGVASGQSKFGIDLSPPLLSFAAASAGPNAAVSIASSGGLGTDNGKRWVFTLQDTGSGFVPNQQTQLSITFNFQSDSLHCVYGGTLVAAKFTGCLDKTSPASVPVDTSDNGGTNPGSTAFTAPLADATNTAQGYYTVHVHAIDQAGNISGTDSTRTIILDNTAPVAGALSQSPNPAVALGSVTMTSAATDNVDLGTWSNMLQYGLVLFGHLNFMEPGGVFHATFSGTLMQSGTASSTISNIWRGMQDVSATGVIQADAIGPADSLVVSDAAGNPGSVGPTLITMSHAANNVLTTESDSLFINSSSATVSKGAASPTSVTLTGIFKGSTVNNPNQPFATLYFYYKNTSGQLVLIGSQTQSVISDIQTPNSRSFTYTLPGVTAAMLGNPANGTVVTIYAVGATSAGDAVASDVNTAAATSTVTVNN